MAAREISKIFREVSTSNTLSKAEIKEELTGELITKAELADAKTGLKTELEGKIDNLKTAIEGKMKLYFLIIIFTIILTNPRAIDLVARIPGLAK